MSEAEAAEAKLNDLITESQAAPAPRAFELNKPYFDVAFSVTWPPHGEIKVGQRFRRPDPQKEESEYKKKCVTEQRVLGGGKTTDEKVKVTEARIWLWDRIATHLKDYPPYEDQAGPDGWV